MDNRVLVAYLLMGALLVVVAVVSTRYYRKRKQVKIRMMGRGKDVGSRYSQPDHRG